MCLLRGADAPDDRDGGGAQALLPGLLLEAQGGERVSARWARITDFRDSGIVTPTGRARYERPWTGEMEPPQTPEGCGLAWIDPCDPARWLCEGEVA